MDVNVFVRSIGRLGVLEADHPGLLQLQDGKKKGGERDFRDLTASILWMGNGLKASSAFGVKQQRLGTNDSPCSIGLKAVQITGCHGS